MRMLAGSPRRYDNDATEDTEDTEDTENVRAQEEENGNGAQKHASNGARSSRGWRRLEDRGEAVQEEGSEIGPADFPNRAVLGGEDGPP